MQHTKQILENGQYFPSRLQFGRPLRQDAIKEEVTGRGKNTLQMMRTKTEQSIGRAATTGHTSSTHSPSAWSKSAALLMGRAESVDTAENVVDDNSNSRYDHRRNLGQYSTEASTEDPAALKSPITASVVHSAYAPDFRGYMQGGDMAGASSPIAAAVSRLSPPLPHRSPFAAAVSELEKPFVDLLHSIGSSSLVVCHQLHNVDRDNHQNLLNPLSPDRLSRNMNFKDSDIDSCESDLAYSSPTAQENHSDTPLSPREVALLQQLQVERARVRELERTAKLEKEAEEDE